MVREAEEPNLQQPFGGEIWKQPDFPCFSVYVVTGVPSDRDDGVKHSHLALSTDPREIGNTLVSRHDSGHMTFTGEELAKYLHDLKYVCQGQLYHILLEEKYPGFVEDLKSDEKRKHEWTGQ
ncbi:MAG: hypothetical protein KAV87_13110 [Desulfobacteraceae bacterium]|nr:hypothetical protein [Desulfobacteraceae bacterium]